MPHGSESVTGISDLTRKLLLMRSAIVDVVTMARRRRGVREFRPPRRMSASSAADTYPVFPCRCGLPRSVSGVSRCGGWRFPAWVSMRFRGIGYDPVREGAMRLAEAKDMVLRLIMAGQPNAERTVRGGRLDGRPATRAVAPLFYVGAIRAGTNWPCREAETLASYCWERSRLIMIRSPVSNSIAAE
jgi:hypothetical protein